MVMFKKRENKIRIVRDLFKKDLNPDVEVIGVKVMQSHVAVFTSTRETEKNTFHKLSIFRSKINTKTHHIM